MKLWLTNHVAAVSVDGLKKYEATPKDALKAFGFKALFRAMMESDDSPNYVTACTDCVVAFPHRSDQHKETVYIDTGFTEDQYDELVDGLDG